MTKKIIAEKQKSLLFSFANIIPYAIVPLVWIGVGLGFENYSGLSSLIAKAVVVTVAKDFLSAIAYIIIITIKGKLKETLYLLKTKAGLFAGIAGIFGGPIGYTLYNSAFFFSGPSYSHIFTSIEPLILVISGILLFKRKYNYKLWLGVGITTIAVASLVFGSAFESKNSWRIIVGALLGIGGAASWALETMLFDKAYNEFHKEKENVTNKLLTIKMISSIFFGFFVMMPIFSKVATQDATFDYKSFGSVFTHSEWLWRFFLAGGLIIFGRYMYFYAINYKGGTMVAVVYNFTVILTPLLMLIWFTMTDIWLTWDGSAKSSQEWIVIWTTTPFIIIGITLVTMNSPRINRKIKST